MDGEYDRQLAIPAILMAVGGLFMIPGAIMLWAMPPRHPVLLMITTVMVVMSSPIGLGMILFDQWQPRAGGYWKWRNWVIMLLWAVATSVVGEIAM